MPRKTSMAFGEAVRIATASLWAHKLRTVLTLLGVVIGVMSVIAVVSVINGLNRYVAEKLFNLGADVFLVSRGPAIITNIDEYETTQKRKKFYLDDYEALRDACRTCVAVGASIDFHGAQVKYGTDYVSNTDIHGWTPEMPLLYDYDLATGRHINRTDVSPGRSRLHRGLRHRRQTVPGPRPARPRNPRGHRRLRGDRRWQETRLGDGHVSRRLGDSAHHHLPQNLREATIQCASGAKRTEPTALDPTMDEVRMILRGRRHLAYGAPDDFVIETNQSFLSIWGKLSGAFFGVTILIASISLVVGGIVIMNIMLVSVTERTREIGLRKSLGARQSDIRLQFLIESATIAAIGGVWGVTLGILLAKIVTWTTPLPSSVQPWSVLAGLLVAISVGLFFGIYPAAKAARLDPVVALRSE